MPVTPVVMGRLVLPRTPLPIDASSEHPRERRIDIRRAPLCLGRGSSSHRHAGTDPMGCCRCVYESHPSWQLVLCLETEIVLYLCGCTSDIQSEEPRESVVWSPLGVVIAVGPMEEWIAGTVVKARWDGVSSRGVFLLPAPMLSVRWTGRSCRRSCGAWVTSSRTRRSRCCSMRQTKIKMATSAWMSESPPWR